MPQRIREVFRDGEGTLRGVGESDEVYTGGKDHNRHESRKLEAGRGTVGQTAVVGAQESGGKVTARPVAATEPAAMPRRATTCHASGRAAWPGIAARCLR